jgi:NAD(P)H-hydrate repair Nnr-like enzyme with NAD(P)H-hydrate dehydratase domain
VRRKDGRLVAITVWGAAIVVFGFSNVLWLSLLMLAVAGMGDMVSGIFRATILQTRSRSATAVAWKASAMARFWATGP